jgi:hypothetical protein
MKRIMRKPSQLLALVIRNSKVKLCIKRNSIRPKVRKIKAKRKSSPSLSIRLRKVIRRNSMIRDKRRDSFLIPQSPMTRMS